MVSVRGYEPADAAALARVFFDAVNTGAVAHYSARQRQAWVPAVPEAAVWHQRLHGLTTFVAEEAGKPIGFMSVDAGGYLDLAFVAPDRIGQGVARLLADAVEAFASQRGIERLTTQASLMARPVFSHLGWQIVAEQTVERNGVKLENVLMEKRL